MNKFPKTDTAKGLSILHPTLFLAQMLAREGNFPVAYLDGFQRLIDDFLDGCSEKEMSSSEKTSIKDEVLTIIEKSRSEVGLE